MPPDAPAAFPAEGARLPRHRAGPIVSGDRPPPVAAGVAPTAGGKRPPHGQFANHIAASLQLQKISGVTPEIFLSFKSRPISDGYRRLAASFDP